MPKTTTKRTKKTPPLTKKAAGQHFPKEFGEILNQLFDAMNKGGLKGLKMARIKCPSCEAIDLGLAWSKATGWMVLCDNCHTCDRLDNIQPIDPETCEVGSEHHIPHKTETQVN